MSVLVRLLHENEISLANDFFNKIYGTSRSLGNFKWEFMDGPKGKAIYIVAIDSAEINFRKIVGIQCAIPLEFKDAHGRTVLSAKSEDTLVDPAYRGQKIFERMYDLLFEECKRAGIHFIWGFTPAKKAFERIGFEIPFQASQALFVSKPLKAYSYLSGLNPQNRLIDKLKIGGLAMLSLGASLKQKIKGAKHIEVKQIPIGSKTDIVEKFMHGSPLHFLNMDSAYMDWRLSKNPYGNHYENLQFYSGQDLIADVLINVRDVGYIEQVIFSANISFDDKTVIVAKAVELLKSRVGLIRILCFNINAELALQEEVFKACGFVVLRRGGHFVWKPLSNALLDPKDLFLTRLFTQGNQ